MNNIDITQKLKYHEKGIKLYSTTYGVVEFGGITDDGNTIFIRIKNKNGITDIISLNKYGQLYDFPEGECILFPSVKNRNWDLIKNPERNTRVMQLYTERAYNLKTGTTSWSYIIPV